MANQTNGISVKAELTFDSFDKFVCTARTCLLPVCYLSGEADVQKYSDFAVK